MSGVGSSAGDFKLIIDSDTDFTAGATTLSANSYSTTTNIVSFNNVNPADGNYFTLGLLLGRAPGGVANNLQFWIRADDGVTSVSGAASAWDDQTPNGRDFSQAAVTRRPDITAEAMNFNPALSLSLIHI